MEYGVKLKTLHLTNTKSKKELCIQLHVLLIAFTSSSNVQVPVFEDQVDLFVLNVRATNIKISQY